jgi:hypothetical protein
MYVLNVWKEHTLYTSGLESMSNQENSLINDQKYLLNYNIKTYSMNLDEISQMSKKAEPWDVLGSNCLKIHAIMVATLIGIQNWEHIYMSILLDSSVFIKLGFEV